MALKYAVEYMKKHAEIMPDRGCQGTLISYRCTLPGYIDHIKNCLIHGNTNCQHYPVKRNLIDPR